MPLLALIAIIYAMLVRLNWLVQQVQDTEQADERADAEWDSTFEWVSLDMGNLDAETLELQLAELRRDQTRMLRDTLGGRSIVIMRGEVRETVFGLADKWLTEDETAVRHRRDRLTIKRDNLEATNGHG